MTIAGINTIISNSKFDRAIGNHIQKATVTPCSLHNSTSLSLSGSTASILDEGDRKLEFELEIIKIVAQIHFHDVNFTLWVFFGGFFGTPLCSSLVQPLHFLGVK